MEQTSNDDSKSFKVFLSSLQRLAPSFGFRLISNTAFRTCEALRVVGLANIKRVRWLSAVGESDSHG